MLYLDSIRTPSDRIKRRAARMTVTPLPDLNGLMRFRITPYGDEFNHENKAERLVGIDMEQGTASCAEFISGRPCQANINYILATGEAKRPRLCAHVYAALKHLKVFEQSAVAA